MPVLANQLQRSVTCLVFQDEEAEGGDGGRGQRAGGEQPLPGEVTLPLASYKDLSSAAESALPSKPMTSQFPAPPLFIMNIQKQK